MRRLLQAVWYATRNRIRPKIQTELRRTANQGRGMIAKIVAKDVLYDPDQDDDDLIIFQIPSNSQALRLFIWMAEQCNVDIFELPQTITYKRTRN